MKYHTIFFLSQAISSLTVFSIAIYLNSFQNNNIFQTHPELKQLAEDTLKFHENGRRLSKRVENTLGKGEIARYEQFLLFPQCFQKACTADT